jgi:hypothetical protein
VPDLPVGPAGAHHHPPRLALDHDGVRGAAGDRTLARVPEHGREAGDLGAGADGFRRAVQHGHRESERQRQHEQCHQQLEEREAAVRPSLSA